MSLADDANLLLIPTGYKAEKLYSIFPTSGVGDFDFARTTAATRVAKNGLITTVGTNVPRLNYDILDGEVVGCPHLLLEDEATNLLQYSEDFSQSYWVNNGVSITSNQVISPDGNLTADLLTGVSGGFGVVVFSKWSSTNNVASCFAKKGSTNLFKIANVSASNRYVIFNLENGTISEEATGWSGSIEDFGNGWYRCTAISNNESGTFSLGVTATSESIYLWGAQLEVSYATSYIKTNGEVNGVTRAAETCNGSGNAATFNDSEGVLMAEVSSLSNSQIYKLISISDGTNNNRVTLGYDNSVVNKFYFQLKASSSNIWSLSIEKNINVSKIAFKYKSGQQIVFVNGFEVVNKTNAFTFNSNLSDLSFFEQGTTNPFYGKTRQIQYHSTALSDSDLEKLTSWTSFEDMAQSQLYTIE